MKILFAALLVSILASIGIARAGSMSKADAICINIAGSATPQMIELKGNGMTKEQMLNPAFFDPEVPNWIRELITGLIHDVYAKDWDADEFRGYAFKKCKEVAPNTPHGVLMPAASGEKFVKPQTARDRWCYDIIGRYAQQVAARKWSHQLTHEQAKLVPFQEETPGWLKEMMANWVDSAYKFTGPPGEWMMQEYHACRMKVV